MAASGVQYKLVILKTFMLTRISHLTRFLLSLHNLEEFFSGGRFLVNKYLLYRELRRDLLQ